MMLREEYQGIECPDRFADPIGYHLWYEANKCPSCNGTGKRWPYCCAELECRSYAAWDEECRTCGGKGTIEEQFDPEF